MEQSKTVTVAKEDLEKLKKLEETYQLLTIELGQIYVERMLTEQHLDDILKSEDDLRLKYHNTQVEETDLADYMTKKYGNGQLNTETGILTLNS